MRHRHHRHRHARRPHRRQRPHRQRRGVLLIVVLSLLVLFALIAFTFVMVAGQYNRAARTSTRVSLTDPQGEELVEQAFYDLLRGTNNQNSFLYHPQGDDDSDGVAGEDDIDGMDNDGDGLIDEDPPGKNVCSSLLEDMYGNGSVIGTVSDTPLQFDLLYMKMTLPAAAKRHLNAYAGRIATVLDGPAQGYSARIALSRDRGTGEIDFYLEHFGADVGNPVLPASGNKVLISGRAFGAVSGADANETYDAPDRLNAHLAFIPVDTSTTSIIPSFADRLIPLTDVNGDGSVDAGDRLSIDNDRDGELDSGWIDMGYEVKTAADGRRYKPIASILCIDLDGRLNLNAHGNLEQLAANYANDPSKLWAGNGGTAGPTGAAFLPRGMGFGPADVNLSSLLSSDAKYRALLEARYGSDNVPGLPSQVEDLWYLHAEGIARNYGAYTPTAGPNTTARNYASPPDVHGRGFIGVDHAGRPITDNMGLPDEVSDAPYQFCPVVPNGKDSPYTAAELERLLRFSDVDGPSLAKIWTRHANLSQNDFASPDVRRSITVASSHVPVPNLPLDVIELMAARIEAETGQSGTAVDGLIKQLMPFEILHGVRMNVNRHWGNSLDNNANGVVDDPPEMVAEFDARRRRWRGVETIFGDVSAYATAPEGWYDNNVPGATPNDGRYLYAKQLFTLMLLVSDSNYKIAPSVETLSEPQRRALAIQRIAQWAVNCVDFRDPDAIMTPFEYDMNPFNGWDVDGDPATVEPDPGDSNQPHPERGVAWGVEAPDLLFTESLAMHDRAVRDTAFDDFDDPTDEDPEDDGATNKLGSKRIHTQYDSNDSDPKDGDKDLDQVRIPTGSLFLEFYCPRNLEANNPVLPRELYVQDASDGNLKLDLDKTVAGSPVWRVAISKPHHGSAPAGEMQDRNARSPLVRRGTHPDTVTFDPSDLSVSGEDPIDRYLWFTATPPAASPSGETAANTFYISDPDPALLAPGRYCVVGPRDETYVGAKPISDEAGAAPETTRGDQLISLNSASPLQMDYRNLSGASNYPLSPAGATNIHPPLALNAVIDSPGFPSNRGLNVSEPLPAEPNAYPPPTHDSDSDGVVDAYGNSTEDPEMNPGARYRDTPLDSEDDPDGNPATPDRPLKAGKILDNQTVENYRTAYLQRLANPLLPWNPAPPHAQHDNAKALNPYVTVDWIPIDLHVFNGEDRAPDDWDTRMGANGAINSSFDTDNDGAAAMRFSARQRRTPGAPIASNNIWTPGGELGSGLPEDGAADECFRYPLHQAGNPQMTPGYVNLPYTPLGGSAVGDPDAPLPWLMWPNRPFVSHYELMLVPAGTQGRLLSEFTRANTGGSPYVGMNDQGMFGHLLNFYQSSDAPGEAPHFYRLLHCLEVPSRFASSQRWLSPRDFANVETIGQFKSPFHNVSRFRDPGRVNINTIPGQEVWEAIDANGEASTVGFTSWATIDATRRGTLDGFGRFGNAFRSSVLSADGVTIEPPDNSRSLDINRSLLRADPATQATMPMPLFGAPASTSDHNDASNNAYFRMQGLQRLGNVVTTQSNVYAVWITIGYFEVDGSGNPLRELGADTGEIVRHRGFFIVDRAMPVGFQRDCNHDVDKAVLLRRYIE